jgi:hypothetical protein
LAGLLGHGPNTEFPSSMNVLYSELVEESTTPRGSGNEVPR